jgi:hypothetical protein
MKVTVTFGNPFAVATYTVALLAIGWAIGAHFKNTVSSEWMIFFATIFLLLHDAAIAILLAIAATKVASSGK